MSDEHRQIEHPELAQYVVEPVPGLALVRYQSALVLSEVLEGLRSGLGGRPIHEVRYQPGGDPALAPPHRLLEECREHATGEGVPVIVLRPEPAGAEPADLDRAAAFWKQMNQIREGLGALRAQVLLAVDEAQAASCFHHAKDLVSWCSPKFELAAVTAAADRGLAGTWTLTSSHVASSPLTTGALHPLLVQVLEKGEALSPADATSLLIPLMRSALEMGAVTRAQALVAVGDRSGFPDDPARAIWHELKGDLYVALGNLVKARAAYQANLSLWRRLAESEPTNARWQRNLSVSHNKIGDVLIAQGELPEALAAYRQALAIVQRLAQSDPANAGWQRDLSVSHERIGDMLRHQGDLVGALAAHRQAITIRQSLADSDPSNAGWQRDLSVSHGWVGDMLRDQGDLAGALASYRASRAIAERLAAADPGNAGWQRDLSISHSRLAEVAERTGQAAEAKEYWRKAYEVLADMKQRGIMLPTDERYLAMLREKAGAR